MMRRKLFFAVFVMVFVFTGWSAARSVDAQQLFRQGNAFFQKGNYQQALEAYQKILDSGFESGELYYNLGNVYFKLHQLGKARLFYERALRLMPEDEALNENLLILKSRLVDKIEKPPKFFLSAWWEALLNFFTISTLAWLVVGLFWLTIFSLAFFLYWRKQRRQEKGRLLVVVSLILLLFSGLLMADKVYRFEKEQYGVILKPTVTVFSEPREQSTEMFVIHEGTKVKILRQSSDWFEIKLEDGKTGWLPKKSLEII